MVTNFSKGLANKKIYAMINKPTITETIKLNNLRRFGHVQRMEGNRIVIKGIIQRSRPRNR
jgi:hypothetical protein